MSPRVVPLLKYVKIWIHFPDEQLELPCATSMRPLKPLPFICPTGCTEETHLPFVSFLTAPPPMTHCLKTPRFVSSSNPPRSFLIFLLSRPPPSGRTSCHPTSSPSPHPHSLFSAETPIIITMFAFPQPSPSTCIDASTRGVALAVFRPHQLSRLPPYNN